MSCMMLDERVYHYVRSAISKHYQSYQYSELRKWTETEKDEFVGRLFEWNQKAYSERYAEEDEIYPLSPGWVFDTCIFQALKYMECIRYQCVDSTEFNSSEDVEALEELISAVKNWIIGEMQEYKAAKWC